MPTADPRTFRLGSHRLGSALIGVGLLLTSASPISGHGGDPRRHDALDWHVPGIERVLGVGRSLGLRGRGATALRTVGAHRCVEGPLLALDVDDGLAFDVDETVRLTLVLARDRVPSRLRVGYDRNAVADAFVPLDVPATDDPSRKLVTIEVSLPRARFANRGSFGTDLALGAPWQETLTLCDVHVERAQVDERAPVHPTGSLLLTLRDAATKAPTSARVGFYALDEGHTGRMPLPSDDAVPLEHFYESARQVSVRRGAPWPHSNRWVFYADSHYRADVPAGRYQVVVAKGLEYRIAQQVVDIGPGAATTVDLALARAVDQPAQGWYSGDAHVHLRRPASRNDAILAQMSAEDLHVTNLLQIGNVQTTYFEQHAFGASGRHADDAGRHVLVSGQEDPTTGHRGHTLALNPNAPVRALDSYFLYHRRFAATRRLGGLSGYAHLSAGWFHVERGLALDVPFGDVDFVEVLQIGLLDTALWYPFLDLGYPMVPAAGSDYPYIDLPGTVRNYVHIGGSFTPQAWFDGLRAGHTFVTNGPFLTLDVGGHGMGETVEVKRDTRIRVRAHATINPDIDQLAALELIYNGRVVASATNPSGVARLSIDHTFVTRQGGWLAVRARGTFQEDWNTIAAHSAPVYLSVDGDRPWNEKAVTNIVTQQLANLDALLDEPLDPTVDLMYWRTEAEMLRRWAAQKPLLVARVASARARYRKLLALLETEQP